MDNINSVQCSTQPSDRTNSTSNTSPSVLAYAQEETASIVLTWNQKVRLSLYFILCTLFILWDYKIAFTILNFVICACYATVIGYRFLCTGFSLIQSPEICITGTELKTLTDDSLPIYTILVPLYHEANIAKKIVRALANLEYPSNKLDVKLLVEADDPATAAACRNANLPPCMEVVVVPEGFPKTKPRACNYGMAHARGEYLVIFDAEDRPEPDQLKKAVLAFRTLPSDVVCLQCKLNYYNIDQNWLTRFFGLEYSAWFDLFLPGLHRLGMPIPLGGTSNHFRLNSLRKLGSWDPHNVTEDCDLGIRIAHHGYRTMILDSTTWEEANSRLWNWIRQRSRWIKGYIQTHFVHTRTMFAPIRNLGIKGATGFYLAVGGLAGILLLNPVYWLIVGLWLKFRWKLIYFDFIDASAQDYTIWSQLSWIFFGITILLLAANILFVLINLAACQRRYLWRLAPYAILSPVYWLLISIAAWKGFLQLLHNPFHWEKTVHGLADLDLSSQEPEA